MNIIDPLIISSLPENAPHPWAWGDVFQSPGAHFTYQVIGPCCRLYDREQLPWPCCRLQWHSKEPSWRRIGRRFVPDMAARKCPSYSVEILGRGQWSTPFVITLYTVKLAPAAQNWWYTKRLTQEMPPLPGTASLPSSLPM